jgi:hypothetical protein
MDYSKKGGCYEGQPPSHIAIAKVLGVESRYAGVYLE